MNFSTALSGIQNQEFWKRKVIKNNVVIIEYKNRLYQMDRNTGVRYPYSPTNADLMANDWYKVTKQNVLPLTEHTLNKRKNSKSNIPYKCPFGDFSCTQIDNATSNILISCDKCEHSK